MSVSIKPTRDVLCERNNVLLFIELSLWLEKLGSKSGSYQVWSDRHRVYDLFRNIDDAVNKFLELAK